MEPDDAPRIIRDGAVGASTSSRIREDGDAIVARSSSSTFGGPTTRRRWRRRRWRMERASRGRGDDGE
jgi:hypothetical protein